MFTEFGRVLKKHRIDEQMKLYELAKKLDVTSSYLSAIENGKRNPNNNILKKIIFALSLDNDAAEELKIAATESRVDHRINVSKSSKQTKEAVAMFARRLESGTLKDEQAKKIIEILGGVKRSDTNKR